MNSAQRQFFNMLVQGANESRADLHTAAQGILLILMLGVIIVLALAWLWILRGGLTRYLTSGSALERKALQEWLETSSPRL